ncbi:hypothetical protein ACP26F_02750 [Franconibacter pulveris 1160]|uniref:Uncharacterized protein n=2 Tax=Franconibacter TaxID=1649295 RepID=A0A0J8VQ18_9ENTR|nr:MULTISPECIES: hypothetical protein [Franconibacter]KMV35271.1 hypothetical protein ACH50_08545 [Franconibacter pulveris]MEB5923634.1 hypothetical protein [Franconibacter daqui]GGD26631.1 hypothetical protein GCM10011513_25080 [Franconibacter daqui]
MDVQNLDLQARLRVVLTKTAALLPADIGQQLLAIISPQSLAVMASVITIWAGAHFFGIGEIADLILLIVGWAATGGIALQAGQKLYSFAIKTNEAHTEAELDIAASELAEAITLIGVNTFLALLLKKKPNDTFKKPFRGVSMPTYSKSIAARMNLPKNGGWRYTPTIKISKRKDVNQGATKPWGDAVVGRNYYPAAMPKDEAYLKMLTTLYHEQVHMALAPKFYLLRELRVFLKQSGYNKSYLLRYLEEAFAETVGLMRARGMSAQYIIEGFKFPLGNTYEITFSLLRHEAAGILLGPVVVGGLMYNVWYGVQR